MTHLRQRMLDELRRLNYSENTVRSYLHTVEDFANLFHCSPDRLGAKHIRQYQLHLIEKKVDWKTVAQRTAGLRFFFVKTLARPWMAKDIPFPRIPRRLPTVLSQQEVAQLIEGARSLRHRTLLLILYGTGLRLAEVCHLRLTDIDNERMILHVREGKGKQDRDVMPSPVLLEGLRAYWKFYRPRTWLFPGRALMAKQAVGEPISSTAVYSLSGCSQESQAHQACIPTWLAPCLRHPFIGSRNRPAYDSSLAGTREHSYHHPLSSFVAASPRNGGKPARHISFEERS